MVSAELVEILVAARELLARSENDFGWTEVLWRKDEKSFPST